MARLNDTQWVALQTAYESTGRSLRDLAADYGISAATICRRAKALGWQRLDTTIAELSTPASAQSSDEILVIPANEDTATDWQFQQQSNQDMQKVRDKAMMMLDNVDSPAQVKSILETLRLLREIVLGKADEARKSATAPQRIERVIVDPVSNAADDIAAEASLHTPRVPKPPA